MINKPNKPENELKSYRPISLLATFSKIFERIFLGRLLPVLKSCNIIPEYQFGFRHNHGTPEQCHRIVRYITNTLESKEYCSAVFLDIQQAFDRVWHTGLLYRLKNLLPAPYYLVLKSYLNDRSCFVKIQEDRSKIYDIRAGVPQGSELGPVLFTIFTSDMPVNDNVLVATYAGDTAILASSPCNVDTSNKVQEQFNSIEMWLNKWNFAVNADKSAHVTFTMNKNDCPKININNTEIGD